MKKFRKLISLMLIIAMTITCLPVVSIGAEENAGEHLTEVPEGYIGIYTKNDLDNIKLDMDASYILMNDIIFEDSDYEKGGDFYNSGKGWEPIGTTDTPFTGTLDGNGYVIKNLYINNPEQNYIGLFGYQKSASVKNLSIDDATIIGNNYVGGITGYIYSDVYSGSDIIHCNFNGSVKGTKYVGGIAGISNNSLTVSYCDTKGSVKGTDSVGGIVGQQLTNPGRKQTRKNYIKYCNNSANVTATNYCGGIVGTSYSYYYSYYVSGSISTTDYIGETYIENCINSGHIVAEDTSAGGIVAYSADSYKGKTTSNRYITNCGNSGSVTATSNAGGLVGKSYDYKTNVKHSYSAGTVNATSNFGGCFGESNVTATFCYYLDEAVNEPTCKTGIAKSEDQLKKQTTFEQWDFNTVWTMEGREDYPYPELRDAPLVLPEDYKEEIKGEVSIVGDTTVGSTLTVDTSGITNENAELTYEWIIDGEVVGTGDSYTLTEEDAGKEITVNVKGDGNFMGTISSTVIIDCIEHSFTKYVSNNDATCTSNGTKTAKCDNCNKTDTITDEGSMTDHDYKSEITTPATHITEGVETFTCICGDSYTKPVAKLEGHTYKSEITTPATHIAEGVETFTCACGDSYTKSVAKLEGHTYSFFVTSPTCTAEGYTTYVCECGDSYVADYVGKLDHSFTNYISDNNATCTSDGTKTAKCDNCNAKDTVTDIGSAKGHNYNIKITNATCQKDGSAVYTCHCGHSYTEIISATGHNDNNYDGYCDICEEDIDGFVDENECLCICHEKGINSVLYKILLFVQRYFKIDLLKKVFKLNRICDCGVYHY